MSQMPLAMPMGRFLWDVAPIAERVQGLGSCVLYAAVRRVLLTYLTGSCVPCLRLGGLARRRGLGIAPGHREGKLPGHLREGFGGASANLTGNSAYTPRDST